MSLPSSSGQSGSSSSSQQAGQEGSPSHGEQQQDLRAASGALGEAGEQLARTAELLGQSSGSADGEDGSNDGTEDASSSDSGEGDDASTEAGQAVAEASEAVAAASEALDILADQGPGASPEEQQAGMLATHEALIAAEEALSRARLVLLVMDQEGNNGGESDTELAEGNGDVLIIAEGAITNAEGALSGALGTMADVLENAEGVFLVLEGQPGTGDEQVADLDVQLNASLVDFDGMLMRERARMRQGASTPSIPTRPTNTPSGSSSQDQSGGAQNGDKQSTATGANTNSAGGESPNASSSRKGSQSSGSNQKTGDGQVIPSGEDDDIVARQIREAAENETDDALRQKLWDEYIAYKQGTGR